MWRTLTLLAYGGQFSQRSASGIWTPSSAMAGLTISQIAFASGLRAPPGTNSLFRGNIDLGYNSDAVFGSSGVLVRLIAIGNLELDFGAGVEDLAIPGFPPLEG